MKSPAVVLSTWPFADGYPWDEELIRASRRALSTHGPTYQTKEARKGRTPKRA